MKLIYYKGRDYENHDFDNYLQIFPGEKRVAISPEAALKMIKLGFNVAVEKGAGDEAKITDQNYKDVGCQIKSTEEVF